MFFVFNKNLIIFKSKLNLKQFSLIRNVCNSIDISKDNEDVGSHVRFNRQLIAPKAEHFQQLYGNESDSDLRLNIELICAEIEYLCQSSHRVKQMIDIQDMQQLLRLGPIGRQFLYNHHYIKGTQNIKRKATKEFKQREEVHNSTDKEIDETTGVFGQNGIHLYHIFIYIIYLFMIYIIN